MATAAVKKKLLYKIAKAYYEDGLTQGEIGKRFGLSRIKISRLLQQARHERIVQITVIPPNESQVDLEREIETKYGLDEVVVVSPTSYDKAILTHELGPAAAECLLRSLQGNEVLALSWGTTLLAVVDALPAYSWPDMKVVQILGGLGRPEAETHGTDLTRRTAEAFGCKPRLLPAPGIVSSKMVKDALIADIQIADTLTLAAQADIALVGIGRPTPDSVVMQAGTLTEVEFQQLQDCGAVGDIALRFFDSKGQAVEHEICNRVMGLDLNQIKNIPRVIGAAGGEAKFEAIRAAVQGKLVDVLITDDKTAIRLLEDEGETTNSESEIPAVVT